jgi:hypothetical protein
VSDDASGVQSIQCDSCDFSYYLLQVNGLSDEATVQNLCVAKCEDFAYNYVSNDSTMTCEYCG